MSDNTLRSIATELDETIRKEYYRSLSETPPEFPVYTHVEEWDQVDGLFAAIIRQKENRSIQPAVERGEDETTTTQQVLDGRTKDLENPPIFATGLSFSKQKMRMGVGRLSSTRKVAQLLADAVRMTQENFFISLLNDADDAGAATEILGFDEKPPIATDHTLAGSSTTVSNKLSVASAVSYTSLNDMVTGMARTVDEDGNPYPIYRLNSLWIPVEEEANALETLKSVGRPDVVQRADNVLSARRQMALSPGNVHSLMYMTADRWFGVDDARHMLTRYVLEAPEVTGPIVDDYTKAHTWLVELWIARCAWGWRGLYMADRPT